jgi:hypothetical protein
MCRATLQNALTGEDVMRLLTGSAKSSNPAPPVIERVRGEFREMPGLTLTLGQAGRLWSLDPSTCSEVMSELVDSGFLCRKADGAFCRASN